MLEYVYTIIYYIHNTVLHCISNSHHSEEIIVVCKIGGNKLDLYQYELYHTVDEKNVNPI